MKTIKIDNLSIPQVILAPMAGVTDTPFRELVKSYGPCLTVSEMISSQAMVRGTRDSAKRAHMPQAENIPIVQIAGCDPDITAEAAKIAESLGARMIDLNFGCPVKKVVGGNAGSALMKDETLAGSILHRVARAVKVPVTVKMRLGWDEHNKNAPRLAKIAQESGIRMITVHGRTRNQMFNGRADWHNIRLVKDAVKIPVIANGDIKSIQDAKACLETSGADGLMIGRAACSQPWLPAQVLQYLNGDTPMPAPNLHARLDMILAHYKSILEYHGEERGNQLARKYIGWHTSGLHGSAKFRMEFNKATSSNAALNSMREYFSYCKQET
jgi:tRNA-dihydrouridine synthase B